MSKHRARSNDRGSGECLPDRGLADGLGTIESRRRGWRSVEVRYVDQPGDADARGDLGDAPGTFGVYVVKSEISSSRERAALARRKEREFFFWQDILCLVITANEVVHNVGVPDALCDLLLVADVPFLPKNGSFFFDAKGSFFERIVGTEDGPSRRSGRGRR
jgi:hypothetical protein